MVVVVMGLEAALTRRRGLSVVVLGLEAALIRRRASSRRRICPRIQSPKTTAATMATTAATAAPAYKPTDEADAAELAADAGAGAPIELGKRMATRARPATVAPGLLLVAAAHAAAKAEKALLTRAESAKARRSAVAKFAGEDPNTDTTAALVKSTETVTTMTLAGCRPRRCRRRAFMTLLPAIVSPAGSLTRFRIEKAEELATPSSEAQAVRSCTPSEGAVTKDKREPPGTEMAKLTLVADGASRGEADGEAVGVGEGVGVCD